MSEAVFSRRTNQKKSFLNSLPTLWIDASCIAASGNAVFPKSPCAKLASSRLKRTGRDASLQRDPAGLSRRRAGATFVWAVPAEALPSVRWGQARRLPCGPPGAGPFRAHNQRLHFQTPPPPSPSPSRRCTCHTASNPSWQLGKQSDAADLGGSALNAGPPKPLFLQCV